MTKQATTAALIWTTVLGTAAIFGSYYFACVFPFAAIATIAVLTLDTPRGLALVGGTWLANQVVGFTLMNYPTTLDTFALGVSLGLGAGAAWGVARLILGSTATILSARTIMALGGAFAAYQVTIFAGALMFGGTENFTPTIIAGVALNDAIWFAGLVALRLALTRAAPAMFGGEYNALPA